MLKVRVPATSANLGPGFDAVGIALKLYNDFYIRPQGKGHCPADSVLLSRDSLAHQGVKLLATKTGLPLPALDISISAQVPRSRGLGSSATLTVAGLMGANAFLRAGLSQEELINLATCIEGHPDNAAPALIGGLVVSMNTPQGAKCLRIMPGRPLQVVVVVPDFELATALARKALPKNISHRDAVRNTGRFGFFMTAMALGEYEHLSLAMEDLLHQPYRMPLVPGLQEVMARAVSAGACGSCLSGAGPSILAFCRQDSERVGRAMAETWSEFGIKSEVHALEIEACGATCQQI